jgi:hypothetical protein
VWRKAEQARPLDRVAVLAGIGSIEHEGRSSITNWCRKPLPPVIRAQANAAAGPHSKG